MGNLVVVFGFLHGTFNSRKHSVPTVRIYNDTQTNWKFVKIKRGDIAQFPGLGVP